MIDLTTLQEILDTQEDEHLEFKEARGSSGSPLSELRQVLPSLTPSQVQGLLQELRREGRVHPVGLAKAGRWFPGAALAGSIEPKD